MDQRDSALERSAFPNQPNAAMSYDEFLRRNPAVGYLKVQASRARGALPTPGVRSRGFTKLM